MRWEAFLAGPAESGPGEDTAIAAEPAESEPGETGAIEPGLVLPEPAEPDDLATIRYTSGTTGEPKGVMFSFGQLAWMGEVLTNLLSWKERNRSMRYLSFLPLSHVVKGILASYAPYYVLCKVDYFYLNQFDALVGALPKVRPNVFFSVPRFYEKLWDQLAGNRFGRFYLDMKDGFPKRLAAAVLRRVVLRKFCVIGKPLSIEAGELTPNLKVKRANVEAHFRQDDLERLVFCLYQAIGITMTGTLPGEVVISRCFFSRYYAPAECALISNLDSGIAAGICGGGQLVFSERITEGCGRCVACLK